MVTGACNPWRRRKVHSVGFLGIRSIEQVQTAAYPGLIQAHIDWWLSEGNLIGNDEHVLWIHFGLRVRTPHATPRSHAAVFEVNKERDNCTGLWSTPRRCHRATSSTALSYGRIGNPKPFVLSFVMCLGVVLWWYFVFTHREEVCFCPFQHPRTSSASPVVV